MKEKLLYCGILLALLFCIGSCRCRDKSEDLSCKLLVYSSSFKIYQIKFNGKDSIETKCGKMDKELRDCPSVGRNSELDSVYVVKKCKLPKNQANKIRSLIKTINSKAVADTLERGVKDVFFFALYLPRQTVAFELVDTGDEDVNRLLELLIDSSPCYVNKEVRIWQDQEYEDYLIKNYGKDKLILSRSSYNK